MEDLIEQFNNEVNDMELSDKDKLKLQTLVKEMADRYCGLLRELDQYHKYDSFLYVHGIFPGEKEA